MAFCVGSNEQGFLYKLDTPVTECSSMVIQTVEEYKQSTVDIARGIAIMFSWAFGAFVVLGWFPGYAIGVAKVNPFIVRLDMSIF